MPTKKNAYKDLDRDPKNITYPLQRLSWSQKKKGDFEWAENCADFYDYYYGNYYDSERMTRLKQNYQLFNGRGQDVMKDYANQETDILNDEGITAGYGEVIHHSLIDQIAKAMLGEQQRRPLKPIAIDTSRYNTNMRKKRRIELMQEFIDERILRPLQTLSMREVLMENKIIDPYKLTPEEQQELKLMVDQRMQAKTPKEINSYMRKNYKTPSETQCQRILDYFMSELDLKYVTDQGFKHAIISGEEIYHVGIRHGKVFVDVVNPMGFTSSAARNTHFIEDGEWAKYERYIKYTDLFNNFGDKFDRKDLRKLDDLFSMIGGGGSRSIESSAESKLVGQITLADAVSGGAIFENAPDLRSREGQEFQKRLYKRFGSDYDDYASIRHVHVVWKSLRKLLYVTRETKQGIMKFWVDESYRFNEMKGDKKIEEFWVPHVWETDKFGTHDALYVNKRPLPYQNLSLDDPWDAKLPYVGIEYGKLFGNTTNVAPMDLGKPWQYKFNVQMAKIHEMEATDVGKVLLTTLNAKPKEWSWGKWLMMLKYGHIAPIDTESENFNPGIDTTIFKSIDLSTLTDLAGRLQYLQFIRDQVALAMSYNPSRLGQVAPYVAVTNTQQSIVQSSYQTEDIYSTHNKVVENLLNTVVRYGRMAFKENPESRTFILDDMSIAELEIDQEMLDYSKMGIKVRNSSDDFNNIMSVKAVGQAMIQNGLISMPELIRLQWATNGAEILNIAEEAQENAEKQRQIEHERQQELQQIMANTQKEMQQMRDQFELLKQQREHTNRIVTEQIGVQERRLANDVDQNNVDDDRELKKLELEHATLENEKDRQLKREELKSKEKIEQRKISRQKTPAK